MQSLESYKIVLLSFWDLSSCVCGCLSLKCLVKTLCFLHPRVSRSAWLNVPKSCLPGSRQPQNFICTISLQEMLTAAKEPNITMLSRWTQFVHLLEQLSHIKKDFQSISQIQTYKMFLWVIQLKGCEKSTWMLGLKLTQLYLSFKILDFKVLFSKTCTLIKHWMPKTLEFTFGSYFLFLVSTLIPT